MRTHRRAAVAAVIATALAWTGCGGDSGTGPGTADLSVAEIDSFVRQNVGLVSGLALAVYVQLTKALDGEDVAGVTVQDRGNGQFDVTAAADADGNGSTETSLTATAEVTRDTGGDIVGVLLNVLSFAGPGGVGANGELNQEVIGGSGSLDNPILLVSSDGMEIELAGGGTIAVPEVGYTLDMTFPLAPFIEGFIDFDAGDVSGTIWFEANGLGGWRTRVEGDKGGDPFEFTVP